MKPTKNRPGRPPIPAASRRTYDARVRVTRAEHALLLERSRAVGFRTVSEFMRRVLFEG